MQDAILSQPLDGGDLVAVGLNRQHRAGLDAAAVEVNGARATAGRVAPDERAGLAELVPEVLHEQGAVLDLVGVRDPVHLDADPGHCWPTLHSRRRIGLPTERGDLVQQKRGPSQPRCDLGHKPCPTRLAGLLHRRDLKRQR